MNSIEELEEAFGAPAFKKFPLTIVRGKGSVVWDDTGKEYLDFMTGIGVALVGHANDSVVRAISEQAARLITCHGSFYNDARAGFMEKLVAVAPKGLGKALLANSGTESVRVLSTARPTDPCPPPGTKNTETPSLLCSKASNSQNTGTSSPSPSSSTKTRQRFWPNPFRGRAG